MIDANAALEYLGHAVVIELTADAAARLDVGIEIPGTVHAVSGNAIGLGLPTYLDPSGELFWVPISGIEDIFADVVDADG
jgi:hypothetical protein